MLGYAFVNLSPEQVEVRRKLLDRAGYQAYVASLFIPAAIYVFRKFLKDALYPVIFGTYTKQSALQNFNYRLCWILGSTKIAEFGPLHVQLAGLLYAAWLLFVIVRGTGDDYMHVTKAFGHVAISQLPIMNLLAFKSHYSPLILATGLTHERLNAYHRMLGRIVHTLLATHAILYLNFFVVKGLLMKRLGDWDVRTGFVAFWSFNVLGLLAIPQIRAKFYHRVFYRSHVILTFIVPTVLYFHVPYTRIYIGQALILWIINGALRQTNGIEVDTTCKTLTGDLVEVHAKVPAASSSKWRACVPGMHGYLNQAGLGPRAPFTVVSVNDDKEGNSIVRFVIRNLGGPTTGLIGSKASKDKRLELNLEGPYGESEKYMSTLLSKTPDQAGKILVVGGGIGATYALPIYTALHSARGGRLAGLKLLWLVKQGSDLTWGLEYLLAQGKQINATMFVTQGTESGNDYDERTRTKACQDFGIEVMFGRASFDQEVRSFLTEKEGGVDTGNITVMVCGPQTLAPSIRKIVGQHVVGTGVSVDWYEEQFGFGGS